MREKTLADEILPGQRLVEAQLAQSLGVSRTPLRYALSVLYAEGLVDRSGARGYVARPFSVLSVLDVPNAIDVRGVLEGLAAHAVAERGTGVALSTALEDCLREGDDIFSTGHLRKTITSVTLT